MLLKSIFRMTAETDDGAMFTRSPVPAQTAYRVMQMFAPNEPHWALRNAELKGQFFMRWDENIQNWQATEV